MSLPPGGMHPVHQLARATLAGDGVLHAPNIPAPMLQTAVARSGAGMDYPAGEQVLALLERDFGERGRQLGAMASLVVSDRRLFGRVKASNVPDTVLDIPFAHVTGARLDKGMLVDDVFVELGPQQIKVPIFAKALAAFFQGLARIPPGYRYFPPPPPPASPQDPIGATTASQRAMSRDARVLLVYRVADEAHRRGELPAQVAADVVSRAELADRGLRMGRGMFQGAWLSVLPRPALAVALQALLGDPAGGFRDAASETYDFAVASGGSGAGAAASTAIGLAMFAMVGVGWVTTRRGQPVRGVRAVVRDLPCGTGFLMLGTTGGPMLNLSSPAPSFVDAIHQALFRLEMRFLLLEAAFGRSTPPDQLFGAPRPQLEQRIASLIGPADLSAFYPAAKT